MNKTPQLKAQIFIDDDDLIHANCCFEGDRRKLFLASAFVIKKALSALCVKKQDPFQHGHDCAELMDSFFRATAGEFIADQKEKLTDQEFIEFLRGMISQKTNSQHWQNIIELDVNTLQ